MRPQPPDPNSADLYGLPARPDPGPRPSPAPLHGPLARDNHSGGKGRTAITFGIIGACVLAVVAVGLTVFLAV